MSLMNDVLQELDARVLTNNAIMHIQRTSAFPMLQIKTLIRLIFLATAVICGIYFGTRGSIGATSHSIQSPSDLPMRNTISSAQSTAPTLAFNQQPATQDKPIIYDAYASPASLSGNAGGYNASSSTTVNDPDYSQRFSQLLAEAEAFMAANQLMTPIGRCAFSRYQEILLLDRNHLQAKQGILTIQKRYVEYFQSAFAEKNIKKAKTNLDKLVLTGMAEEEFNLLRNQWLQLKAEMITHTNHTSIRLDPTAVQTRIETDAGIELIAETTPAAASSGAITVTDSTLARQAQLGQLSNPIEQLHAYLQVNPNAQETPFALALLYAAQKNIKAMEQVINSYPFNVTRTAYLKAKLALVEKNYPLIVQLLANIQPEPAYQDDFYVLHALGLQNSGDFEQAAALYQLLLKAQPNNAQLWLGLAVCYEASFKSQQALLAYKQAQALGNSSPAVQQYIHEKLKILQP